LASGAGHDELKVAELSLNRNGLRVQCVMSDCDAIVVGPAEVAGIDTRDRRATTLVVN